MWTAKTSRLFLWKRLSRIVLKYLVHAVLPRRVRIVSHRISSAKPRRLRACKERTGGENYKPNSNGYRRPTVLSTCQDSIYRFGSLYLLTYILWLFNVSKQWLLLRGIKFMPLNNKSIYKLKSYKIYFNRYMDPNLYMEPWQVESTVGASIPVGIRLIGYSIGVFLTTTLSPKLCGSHPRGDTIRTLRWRTAWNKDFKTIFESLFKGTVGLSCPSTPQNLKNNKKILVLLN